MREKRGSYLAHRSTGGRARARARAMPSLEGCSMYVRAGSHIVSGSATFLLFGAFVEVIFHITLIERVSATMRDVRTYIL